MKEIEQRLRTAIGLEPASIGPTALQRAVRARMKDLGLSQLEDYKRQMAHSPLEQAQLVEAVVVGETWFFRDPGAFDALVRLVSKDWLPAQATERLRLLSIPCSSGEEPYSIAMALADAGVPSEQVHIDAIDISAHALAVARRAIYRKNSFRGRNLAFRERHFRSVVEGFAVDPELARTVHFSQGNLFSDDFLADKTSYDFIFCRNLLIYCEQRSRQKALNRLARLLAPAGVMFVGPAEHPVALEHGFVSANLPLAFGCRKQSQAPAHADRKERASATRFPLRPGPAGVERRGPPAFPASAKTGSAGQNARAGSGADLAQIRCLADAGRLAEAATLCEDYLRQSRDSAHAYYLLGLVRDARGDASAIECYRKALYLEPEHYETLLQMSLLAEKNGDAAAARGFKRRATRLKTKT